MRGHLSAGPVRFVLQWDDALGAVRYDDWAYRHFFRQPSVDEACPHLIEIPVEIVHKGLNLPSGPPLFKSGDNWAVWPEEPDAWLFCARFFGRARPFFSCRVKRDLSEATLYVEDNPFDAPLRYPLDQVLTWGLLSRCGGVLMHAAAVVDDAGVGHVFAGRSGAGKSTLSALCQERGWRVLNDDRIVLFQREGRPRLAGTPWHGSGLFAEPDEVALGGIHLLAQADTQRFEKMEGAAAHLDLLDVTSIPWFDATWSQGALDALAAIARLAPVHRFHFTKTPAAVEFLESELQQETP